MNRYLYCNRCGAEGPARRTDSEYVCEACGFKHFINPIAAVAAVLVNARGEILLLRRGRDPGKGMLGMPGGFIDVGETAEEALRREIKEEIGLEVSALEYFASLPNEYVYQGVASPVLDLFYVVRVETFEGATPRDEEVAGLEVVVLDTLDFAEMAFPSNAEALRRFARRS